MNELGISSVCFSPEARREVVEDIGKVRSCRVVSDLRPLVDGASDERLDGNVIVRCM